MNEQPDTSAPAPLIELRGITKAFPGVVALNDVDLTIRSSEVHALTGENGSGKSTLARVINGSVQPDAGTISVEGRRQQVKDPRAALRLGIVTISQELTLAPTLSVAENIFLGRLPRRAGRVDWRRLRRQATEVLDRLDVHVKPTTIVDQLSVEMQQEVEIARAISSNARLLILDEATSSLSEAATQRLLSVVEEQRAAGVAVLMISHRMPELYAAASCATVLRDGHLVGTCRLPETNEQRLVSMMVGRELGDYYGKRQLDKGEAILEVTDVATQNGALRPTSLRVHRGEILGVAGLVGSGKAELGMALGGAIPCTGSVRVNGKDVAMGDPRSTLSGGIGFVPDDRKRSALLPTRSVSENFSIAWNGHLSNSGRARHARRAPHGARRDHALRGDHRVRGEPDHDALRRQPAEGRARAHVRARRRGARPRPSRPAGSTSARRARSTGSCRRRRRRVPPSSSSPPSSRSSSGIADRIVVFYGGEVRGEFSGRGMQEEDIAHVAVTGASMAPDQQTIMETS